MANKPLLVAKEKKKSNFSMELEGNNKELEHISTVFLGWLSEIRPIWLGEIFSKNSSF